jgi:hypothetical protein
MDSFASWSPYNAMERNPLFKVDKDGDAASGFLSAFAYLGYQGTKGAAIELATQLTTKTLENAGKQMMKNPGAKVNMNKAFQKAWQEVNWSDVAISGIANSASLGAKSYFNLSTKGARISDAVTDFVEIAAKAGVNNDDYDEVFKDLSKGALGKSISNSMTDEQVTPEMMKGLRKNIKKIGKSALKEGKEGYKASMISKFATNLASELFIPSGEADNEPSYSREPGNPSGYKGF